MSETRTTTAATTAATAGKPKTITTTETKTNEEIAAAAAALASAVASTTLLGTSSKLLLKNKLHLNLNVISDEHIKKVDSQDKRSRRICKLPSKGETTVETTTAEVLRFKDDVSNLETTTVTTVPQIQQKQQKRILEASKTSISSSVAAAAATTSATASSSSSLLNSSPSALAKFNRIIDSTMSITDCYQQSAEKLSTEEPEQQQRQQQHHQRGIFTTIDSRSSKKIDFPTGYNGDDDDVGLEVELDNVIVSKVVKENDDEVVVPNAEHKIDENDDNQMKRNDVHYLLKQLNSFSDIEEIEIVDMKQKRQQQAVVAARAMATATAAVITHSPTTTSLVIISPSSQSHKESRHVMRRFASMHQQHQYSDDQNQYDQNQHHQYQHQQHHHHHHHHRPGREQQQHSQHPNRRHYTLNASGGNLLERFDPATEQQYLLQQFDDYLFESCHYLETNYFAATYRTAMIESSSHEFRPSTTTGTRSSPSATGGSPHSYEVHEIELPSVICRAPPPPPSPTRRFNTQARLTSSGVQTELTASSLTSTTTTTSHAAAQSMTKSSSGISGVSACSSYTISSTEQRRRMPFFKCCYAPIDRWREKRSAGSRDGASGAVDTTSSQKARSGSAREATAATTHGSVSRRGSQRQQQKKQHSQARKSGSDV